MREKKNICLALILRAIYKEELTELHKQSNNQNIFLEAIWLF